MTLLENWNELAYCKDESKVKKFWDNYSALEQKIYEYILRNKTQVLEGTVLKLAQKFDLEPVYFLGFIDGINEALENKINLEELNEESFVSIKINFEKLYKKMIEYKAQNLYELKEWENIFDSQTLKKFLIEQKKSNTYIKKHLPGRNEPCICGSGLKYKKCCGKK